MLFEYLFYYYPIYFIFSYVFLSMLSYRQVENGQHCNCPTYRMDLDAAQVNDLKS